MTINESLLEIREYTGEGYLPLIDYEQWRVAILRFIDELLPENLMEMQRHDETDEVFVLLQGKCILFLADGRDAVNTIYAEDMQPLKLYNVKCGSWHTHTLSKDAVVLIVENRDTTLDNSPRFPLTPLQTENIISLTNHLWENKTD